MLGSLTTGAAVRRRIEALDPEVDDEEITRLTTNVLFADAYFAHATYLVTFVRQIAIPRIAQVLYRGGGGDIVLDPRRRNNDTIIFFTEFYRRGYKSADGRSAIQRMEEIHSRFKIDDELKLYTLATVMLEPDRLAKQFGCDPFTETDRQARWNFWCGVAGVMGLEMPAGSRAEFEQWMLGYEAEHYAPTDAAAGCYEGLVRDWIRWYPKWIPNNEWLARHSLAGLLTPELREIVGVPAPPGHVQRNVNFVARSYMRSTPVRVMRRDRDLIGFFGKDRVAPRELSGVGHAAP